MCNRVCNVMSEGLPSGDVGQATACKRGCPAHATRPDICARGHRLIGYSGPALATNEHSELFRKATEAARHEIAGAVLRDQGHDEESAPEVLRHAAAGFAQSVLLRDSAFARVAEAGGPMTSGDRTRRAFEVWVKAATAAERLARVIGLQRVPKPAASPIDYINGKADA
jgi:hypothetical protein